LIRIENIRGQVDENNVVKNFEFVDEIKGGAIPREFIPAIEKGSKETMKQGIIA